MKHAYLILAHNQFEILEILIAALDDKRNDIYIHIDKKVDTIPLLQTEHAELHVLKERIAISWGDVSIVEAELLLFQKAKDTGIYSHYHLLSGVDLPLQSQDNIHAFCAGHPAKQFIGYSQGDQRGHISRKVQRYHIFPKHFRSIGSVADKTRQALRFLFLRVQFIFGILRNTDIELKKGTQWLSLTGEFVVYLLQQKQEILKRYRYTFCADEIFVQTACWNSPFREQIYDLTDEGRGSQRLIQWRDNQLYDWEDKDVEKLNTKAFLFARKFNDRNMEVVTKILEKIKR
ncbi:beta-1,6-N-acetylglucosaminyltransferase [Sphingobacterium bambusae]|uniref:Peptide O-xylosyltransferase n=1 Tax=Sphingobacterium bambusae TaxID=662858 RepID=A0ABW6BFT5_9SPHI|nr:beta-1,6-N-acetylglucosaminyltransferase [Sphingobacterium bambusae]WPL46979.1 beta-1,6-N-acetylglucosaminyltransferase [Sphingobacterium bambusae]